MNAEKFERFSAAYLTGLHAAVLADPEAYGFADIVPHVADKMLTSMAENPMGVNYDGGGFKRACKALGIKHTRKAIFAYLEVPPKEKV